MRTIFILAAVMFTAAPLLAQPAGDLVGCVRDGMNFRLPRATVVVRARTVQRVVLGDALGCYEIKSLPPDVYRVTARLEGFDNQTQEHVRIEPGSTMRVDLQMAISTMCECLPPPRTVRERWEKADAVVHLRITDHEAQLPTERGFFGQTAEVLEVLKRHSPGGPTEPAMSFLQGQTSGEPDPYYPGEEFVLFLRWSPQPRTLVTHTHAAAGLAIRAGTIDGGTMGVADLLAELRSLSGK